LGEATEAREEGLDARNVSFLASILALISECGTATSRRMKSVNLSWSPSVSVPAGFWRLGCMHTFSNEGKRMSAENQRFFQIYGDSSDPSKQESVSSHSDGKREARRVYQVITQVSIRNFRCFKELELSGLKQINLVVGKNSSGKSALMESIFFSSGPGAPAVALQLRAIRRMGTQYSISHEEHYYRELWGDLFFDFNDKNKVSIKLHGNPASDERKLTIEYGGRADKSLTLVGKETAVSGNNTNSASPPQIVFTWKRQGFKEFVARPKLAASGIQHEPAEVAHFPCLWFTPGIPEAADESAKRFSEVEKRGDLPPVIEALKSQFPFIKGLSIQYLSGFPMLFASVDGRSRMMPVALISDGVSKLISILVGMAYMKGGTVLIEQIEDGFHYILLPSIWSSLYAFATLFGVQVFVSSHSKECIDAILPVVDLHEDAFSLLVTGKDKGEATVRTVTGKLFKSSVEEGFDLR
jgi:hypothetical protein